MLTAMNVNQVRTRSLTIAAWKRSAYLVQQVGRASPVTSAMHAFLVVLENLLPQQGHQGAFSANRVPQSALRCALVACRARHHHQTERAPTVSRENMLGRTAQRRVNFVLKENSVKKLVYLCVKSVSSDSMA